MIQLIRNTIPNALTCLNLICGVAGIILLAESGIEAIQTIELLLVIAGIADFFDGFAARLLRSDSAIGKDLDSLADAITFGVLPTLAVYLSLKNLSSGSETFKLLPYLSILIALCSVIRLAIFNNDSQQSDQFIGVPTPANAFFLIFLTGSIQTFQFPFQINVWAMSGIVIASSLLLVSKLPLMALKFKHFGLDSNLARYALILISVVTLFFFGKLAVPLIYSLYLLFSLILKLLNRNAV